MTQEITLTPPAVFPVPLLAPTPKAAKRVLFNATRRFAEWCEAGSVGQLADVHLFRVAAFVRELQGEFTPPTVKQHRSIGW